MALDERNEDARYLTCQTILHTLKFYDGITIVKPTANKNSCNCFGDRKRHIYIYTGKYGEGHECDKAAKICLGNMLSKIQIVIKGKS